MARKEKDVDVGSLRLRIKQLGAVDGPPALARVGRMLGPAMLASDPERIAVAFFAGFSDNDYAWLRDKFLANSEKLVTIELSNGGTREQAQKLRLEEFDGDIGSQLSWMVECVKHNFADFLGGGSSLLRQPVESTPASSS